MNTYSILTRKEAKFNGVPKHLQDRSRRYDDLDYYGDFEEDHLYDGECNLTLEGYIWDVYSLIKPEDFHAYDNRLFLVMNVYADDHSDPVEKLKEYHYNYVDYLDYKNGDNSQIPIDVTEPEIPDVFVVKIEGWMRNYISDGIVNKMRIAHRRNLLNDPLFVISMRDLLQNLKDDEIAEIVSNETSPHLTSLIYKEDTERGCRAVAPDGILK